MKVKWVSQENPTSAADALEKSIAKWRFFSCCTKKQFCDYEGFLTENCGLCHRFKLPSDAAPCALCILQSKPDLCCEEVLNVARKAWHDATLAEFHTAARKVAKKLRSLRQ